MRKQIDFVYVLVLFFSIITTAGCASGEKTIAALNSVNHVNQAMATFGTPANVISMPDGGSIYVWSSRRVVDIPSYQATSQQHYGYAGSYLGSSYGGYWTSQSQELNCEVRVMANVSGMIVSKSVQGNACP